MTDLVQENSPAFDLSSFDLTSFSEPRVSSLPVGEKYLAFSLDGDFYAIASKNVIEAAPSLPVAHLPNAPEWLIGIANLRGEVISVVNLPAILGNPPQKPAPKQKFIVLRSQIFDSGVAFAADKLNELVSLPDERIQFGEDRNPTYIFGTAVHESKTLHLIDTEKLLSALAV